MSCPLPLPKPLHVMLADLEKELIIDAMKRAGGNCAYAADLLGINRTTLVEKRKKYGLPTMPAGRPPYRRMR